VNPVIRRLILKDWRLNRSLISLTVAVGLVALVLMQSGSRTHRLLGGVWFFVALCILASMLPARAILNERRKQTLAFVMSLPISSVQYSIAKIVSLWAMFLLPWLTLLASALLLIDTRQIVPRGAIPMLFIVSMLPFVGFCLISAAALVGESEGWLGAAGLLCNSSYWFVWYLLARIPSLTAHLRGPVAVWNSTARTVFSAEIGLIVLILALTLFFQSRKRDFI